MDMVRDKVVAIIAEQALIDPAEISDDTSPDDLGLDSLTIVEVVLGIEEAFNISLPYNADDPTASQVDLSTVGMIVAAVEQFIASKEEV